jgi:hypothetical protein
MERVQQLLSGMAGRGGQGGPAGDTPQVDTAEQIYISSLALLKMLKHGEGVTLEGSWHACHTKQRACPLWRGRGAITPHLYYHQHQPADQQATVGCGVCVCVPVSGGAAQPTAVVGYVSQLICPTAAFAGAAGGSG